MSSTAIPSLPRNLMLGLSFGQGLILLFLWRALDGGTWPSQTPALNFPLWTFAVVWPGLLLLSLETGNQARVLKLASLCTAVLLLPAIYIGWQASPVGAFPVSSLVAVFVITMLVACFKTLMHLQLWAAQTPQSYAALFAASWRNFLVAALSLLLIGGVYAILFLWGALFAVIGIEFFQDLFEEDWFLFPVLAVAFGLGVLIFRRLINVIDGITRLLEGLMRLLLPLAAVVLLIFLAALPFTGLAPLWATGSGTALLMWLNAFVLFFLNAVYQTGREVPYPPLVHRLLQPGVALLPVLSGLALYGLYLRMDQYGWTLSRSWAFTVCALLALFSLGYAWIIIRRRDGWPQDLGRVNILMGWLVLGLMILVNTPVLDFRAISLASQLGRVEAGEIEMREFDFHYAWRDLARPAHLKMQALIEENEDKDPELVRVIEDASSFKAPPARNAMLWERIVRRPEPFEVPPGVRSAIEDYYADPYTDEPAFDRPGVFYPRPHPSEYGVPILLRADLNADGAAEYVFLAADPNDNWVFAFCIYREGGQWRRQPMMLRHAIQDGADLAKILREGEISSAAPKFEDLRIGELTLGLM